MGVNQFLSFQTSSLGHEISAPYEVPQFPIEQLESKLLDLRKSSICPSANLNNQVGDESDFITEDFVPHFQRVNISGEDITGQQSALSSSLGSLLNLFTVQVTALRSSSQSPSYFTRQ